MEAVLLEQDGCFRRQDCTLRLWPPSRAEGIIRPNWELGNQWAHDPRARPALRRGENQAQHLTLAQRWPPAAISPCNATNSSDPNNSPSDPPREVWRGRGRKAGSEQAVSCPHPCACEATKALPLSTSPSPAAHTAPAPLQAPELLAGGTSCPRGCPQAERPLA